MRPYMRAALEQAARHQIRRVHEGPGKPVWEFSPATLHALVRREYLERTESKTKRGAKIETWTITELGKAALVPHWTHEERSTFVATGAIRYRKKKNAHWEIVEDGDDSGNYTTDPSRSIDWDPRMGALPVTDPERLKVRWRKQSAEEYMAAKDPNGVGRKLAKALRAA